MGGGLLPAAACAALACVYQFRGLQANVSVFRLHSERQKSLKCLGQSQIFRASPSQMSYERFQTVSNFRASPRVFLQRGKWHKNVSDSLIFFGLRPGKCHKKVSDSLNFSGLRPGVFAGRQMSQDILIMSRHWGIFAGNCLTTLLLCLDIDAPKIQANVARDCRDRYT